MIQPALIGREFHFCLNMQKQETANSQRAEAALKHLQKELQVADAECHKKLKQDANIAAELAAAKKAVDNAEAEVAEVPIDMKEVQDLEQAVQQQQHAVRACREKCRTLEANLSHVLNFSYSIPRPGFDQRSVKGVLARLVRVKDSSHATALEVAAGSKLSHVVVDTDAVGAFVVILL